ncbi:hypothetical protein KSP39_PZI016612 [Platanthera zijinensis]|uniref:DEP domain-containing protein n=1 Tax=Platanthera zijinensis TaxID=2320716 RepID=A0AAP0B6R5_9ASPA
MEGGGKTADDKIIPIGPNSVQKQNENGDLTVNVEGKMGSMVLLEDGQVEKFTSKGEVGGELYNEERSSTGNDEEDGSVHQVHASNGLIAEKTSEQNQIREEEALPEENEVDPVFDGTEGLEREVSSRSLSLSSEQDSNSQTFAWPEKAVAFKNFVKDKGSVAVSSLFRRLSGKKDDDYEVNYDAEGKSEDVPIKIKEENDLNTDSKLKDVLVKAGDISTWNPLNYIKIGRDADVQNRLVQKEEVDVEKDAEEQTIKGRVIVYTRLGCQACRSVRLFMRQKRIRYVEVNVDIYPTRKFELEKTTGSSKVPQVYFNEVLIGGLDELLVLDESGRLHERINALVKDEPSSAAPSPPLPGEDDVTGTGKIDELALLVRKMKGSIVVKERFYKMRMFSNCFIASEAVDFLAEDQYLEREEAVELGRKLASQHFFRHVLDENIFEDGSYLYRFLEDDPTIMTQCHNVPAVIIDVQPKPITEIASNLRLLSYGIFEAYVSEDGRHVDYKSIHCSEEFKRYLRLIEGLQRGDLEDLSREEKLAFFINLYNMMVIHAIWSCGYPVGSLDRRKFLGDFKYVIGGSPYSLSAIQNGVLRGNQRPPYNLTKPFGSKDKRSKVTLSYAEPLIHFALVSGTRSGPALRCYSPGDIDKELVDAARTFLRNGGVVLDAEAKVVSASRILRWYSVDFGKNEDEVLKHTANYLEPTKSEELLELLAGTRLKVVYQPYDWGLNCY